MVRRDKIRGGSNQNGVTLKSNDESVRRGRTSRGMRNNAIKDSRTAKGDLHRLRREMSRRRREEEAIQARGRRQRRCERDSRVKRAVMARSGM